MTALRVILSGLGVLVTLAGVLIAVAGLAGVAYHMGLNTRLDPHVMGLHELLDQALGEPTWKKFLGWLGGHMLGLILVAFGRTMFRAGVARPEAPPLGARPPCRRWTEAFCVGLIMVILTYVNLVKNVETWTNPEVKAMQGVMYGLRAYWWFSIGYLTLLAAFVILAIAHMRRPLAVVPESWLGKGQLLYLAFLWVMVIGNLMRAIPPFKQERLITEGVIIVNAILCTVLILLLARTVRAAPAAGPRRYAGLLGKIVLLGVLGFIVLLGAQTGVARLLYGDEQAPGAGRHIRFGPDATAKGEPKPGQAHP